MRQLSEYVRLPRELSRRIAFHKLPKLQLTKHDGNIPHRQEYWAIKNTFHLQISKSLKLSEDLAPKLSITTVSGFALTNPIASYASDAHIQIHSILDLSASLDTVQSYRNFATIQKLLSEGYTL